MKKLFTESADMAAAAAVRWLESRSETSGGQAAQPVSYSMFQRLNLAPEVFTVSARQSVLRVAVQGANRSAPLQACYFGRKTVTGSAVRLGLFMGATPWWRKDGYQVARGPRLGLIRPRVTFFYALGI